MFFFSMSPLWQASDWPMWPYSGGYIATCRFNMNMNTRTCGQGPNHAGQEDPGAELTQQKNEFLSL